LKGANLDKDVKVQKYLKESVLRMIKELRL
jgi:hypothetical protein